MLPDKPPLDEALLEHHGILGMHWGRHKSEGSPKITKADKKAAKVNTRAALNTSLSARLNRNWNPVITQDEYNKLSTKNVTIEKGSDFARVSTHKDENYKNITYVSWHPEDKVLYRAVMPNINKKFLVKSVPNYEHTLKTVETLSGPSEKARVDAFSELMDTPSIRLKNGKTTTARELLRKQGFKQEVKQYDSHQLGLRFYNQFMANSYMETPLSSAYFNNLKTKGYNMVADDNDRNILSREPLILLNPNGSIKKMSVRQLTPQDINEAERTFKAVDIPKQ